MSQASDEPGSQPPDSDAPSGEQDASPQSAGEGGTERAIVRQFDKHRGETLAAGLYLVATPIGNLGDITLRALATLQKADIIYCEDTRHSARLLQHYAIRNQTRPLHDHNENSETARILRELEQGKRIAVISDAGTPLISDPGFKLVRAAVAAGHSVQALPGASSVITAMAASGLATDAFFFAGFLPPKAQARRVRLSALKSVPGSLVLFEAPQRLAESLSDMAEMLGDRDAVVARELTKLHEELARGLLPELATAFAARDIKGEIVVVIGPAAQAAASDEVIAERLTVALQSMSLKDAAKAVSDALGVPKSRVYDLGLKAKNKGA